MSTNPDDYPPLPQGVYCPHCSANNAQLKLDYLARLEQWGNSAPPPPVQSPDGLNVLTDIQLQTIAAVGPQTVAAVEAVLQ